MKDNFYEAPFEMQKLTFDDFPANIIRAEDFRSYVEEGDVIQKAVDACRNLGGGTVMVGLGEWITGPIHLYDNIHIHFEPGAILRFSKNFTDYLPVVFTRWEGMECYNYSPLIYAKDCENIAITGEGLLHGSGEVWWHWKKLQQKAANDLCYAESNHIPVDERIYGTVEAALRPSFIQFVSCKNIQLSDFTIKDGPQWMIHPVYCHQLIVKNVSIISKGPNTDGLNPDSCNNVLIENCYFHTGDDCIALNSGMNEDGWRVNKPCENIIIRNCTMEGGHGGIVIGSGMSGGVKNIYAHDCKIQGTNQGIRLKSMRGRGGYVKDIWFENIQINQVLEEAVQINMFYKYSTVIPKSLVPSDFTDIHLKNIYGIGADTAVEICGLPEHFLRNISFENIELSAKKALICDNVDNLKMKRVLLQETNGGLV
jgi:polygalacturonase